MTDNIEPYSAHGLLEIRTVTVTVSDAARLISEHRALEADRDEARTSADQLKALAETVTLREQRLLEDKRVMLHGYEQARDELDQATARSAKLAREVEHHRERRAIPAGIKWQTLIETLRERGVGLRYTDMAVDDLVERIVRDAEAQQATADAEAEQATADIVAEAMTAELTVDARVRLADSNGYPYAPHGALGTVVEPHAGGPFLPTWASVQWDGQTGIRTAHAERLEILP